MPSLEDAVEGEDVVVEKALRGYHLLPAVRGDLLERAGQRDEAAVEFAKAASLTKNERERKLLLERARACGDGGG